MSGVSGSVAVGRVARASLEYVAVAAGAVVLDHAAGVGGQSPPGGSLNLVGSNPTLPRGWGLLSLLLAWTLDFHSLPLRHDHFVMD